MSMIVAAADGWMQQNTSSLGQAGFAVTYYVSLMFRAVPAGMDQSQ
jgi:hypothetical protein